MRPNEPAAADPNELAAAALPWAIAYARKQARRRADREALADAATDAVVWAVRNYRPGRRGFADYARRAVEKRVAWALDDAARRPADPVGVTPIRGELVAPGTPATGAAPLPRSVRELPPDLRDAVRFYHLDQLPLRTVGRLCGVSHVTIRSRLIAAAKLLAGGEYGIPLRPRGVRRLKS